MDEKKLFMKKFEEKLKNQLDHTDYSKLNSGTFQDDLKSVEYETFREESLSASMSKYEKICDYCEKLMPIKPDKKTENTIQDN